MAKRAGDYKKVFAACLDALPQGEAKWVEELIDLPGLPATSPSTKKKYLKEFITERPDLLRSVRGLFPEPKVILDLVESDLGKQILEANLDVANQKAAELVRGIAGPVVHRFVQQTLEQHLHGSTLRISLEGLMTFLLDDFTEFTKGAGNGLVSIAGGLNERLLIRAMENAGLQEKVHFAKTGTDSKADLVIYSKGKTRDNLGVEIKSYHARERLLRGLQDIKGSKVGVGWFQSPAEFNEKRTKTLLQTDVAAIYMPQKCLAAIDGAAKAMTTNAAVAFQSRLYRPIERFVTDMREFNVAGQLPHC